MHKHGFPKAAVLVGGMAWCSGIRRCKGSALESLWTRDEIDKINLDNIERSLKSGSGPSTGPPDVFERADG